MAVRVEKRSVSSGWGSQQSGVAVLDAQEFRVTGAGLVRAQGGLAYEALANGNRVHDNDVGGLTIRTATGELVSSLGAGAGCGADSRESPPLVAVAPDRRSVGVLRDCGMASTWNLIVVADSGAPLVDARISPRVGARLASTRLAVANDHVSAVSFFGSGLLVSVDGSSTPIAKLAGTIVGAVGSGWVSQEGTQGTVHFHFLARDGRELRTVEVAGLEEMHIGTASSAKGATATTTEPVKLFGDRLFVMKSRPALPLPEDGQTLSERTLQQYGEDGTLLREDAVAF